MVSNVSFTVEPGKVAVLAGPNGAGKSTKERDEFNNDDKSLEDIFFQFTEE